MKETNMKKITFLFLFIQTIVFAQDTKVTTGIVNFNQNDFQNAIDNLEIALSNTKDLKPSNIPKAYYYYGMSLKRQYEATYKEHPEKLQENYMKALDAFNNSIKTDDGKWKEKCEMEKSMLVPNIINFGMLALNEANAIRGFAKSGLLDKSEKFLEAAINNDSENYLAYDLLAQVKLAKGDSVQALNNFKEAFKYFESKPPKNPDLLIAYVGYRLALLERYKNNDLDKALSSLEKGKLLLEKEYNRTSEKTESVKKTHENAQQDLSNFELDIYLNVPEKLNEALKKFENAIKAEPNNYIKHVAYASLLEKTDVTKAIEVYEKATKINPSEITAWFNLGALYNNMAAQYSKQANETDDYSKTAEFQKQAVTYLEKAYPNFQNVHQLDPKDISTVNALLQIAITTGKTEDYNLYKEKKKALGY